MENVLFISTTVQIVKMNNDCHELHCGKESIGSAIVLGNFWGAVINFEKNHRKSANLA
jgi:hypothetical protein